MTHNRDPDPQLDCADSDVPDPPGKGQRCRCLDPSMIGEPAGQVMAFFFFKDG